jgi:hypothetical protein
VLYDLVVVRVQLLAGFLHEHQNRLAAIVRKVQKRSVHMQEALSLVGALVWLRLGLVQGAGWTSTSCSWRRGGISVTIIIIVTVRLLKLCCFTIVLLNQV